jgi:GNAT superfamily N-acetyltransferase
MSLADLIAEIGAGVAFWGLEDGGTLVGVMGLQKVRDATLIRHAYVRPAYQGRGIGGALLATLAGQTTGPLLVGTWAAAEWAIRFYARHGFRQVSVLEKERLLQTYWSVSLRQQESSVVLVR